MSLATKGQFDFSLFKVNSQNPKFSLEYLLYKLPSILVLSYNFVKSPLFCHVCWEGGLICHVFCMKSINSGLARAIAPCLQNLKFLHQELTTKKECMTFFRPLRGRN